ncbi:MAG TPA: acetylornithine/succinylornithine family transaminase [bacterium]|nr:acetylornithine/succinylornithine family transaminase [bacterium]
MKIEKQEKKLFVSVYRRYPLEVRRAAGKYLWDAQGNKYLDFLGGIAVQILGHRHPAVLEGIRKQMARYLHVSNLYYTDIQTALAGNLVERSFPSRVFFSNSGAEANEAALKLVRKIRKGKTLSFKNSFHGRTFLTLSATGQEKIRASFRPLPDFIFAQFNDIVDVRRKTAGAPLAGIIVEPLQAEAGVYPARKDFLIFLRRLADQKKIPLIFDEIQTGIGRTGRLFAFENYGVVPDIMTLGKAVGGGLPLGVTLFCGKYAKEYLPGDHASTFGGNPLACAAGLRVLEVLNAGMLAGIRRMGKLIEENLNRLAVRHSDIVSGVRGEGLIWAVEFKEPVAESVRRQSQENGLLINNCKPHIIRLLPPGIISEPDVRHACSVLDKILKEKKEFL